MCVKVKIKLFCLRHDSTGISPLILKLVTRRGVSIQRHASAALPKGKPPRYTLNK
jgi:hypothetical protein